MTINMTQFENSTVGRGQTQRVNHDDCEAGTDTRRRLYLTRPTSTPNVLLGYCHNCQEHGVLRDGTDQFKDFDITPIVEEKRVPFAQPATLVPCVVDTWPTQAMVWRIQKNLTIEDCHRAGIKYDLDTHRVYLPMWKHLTTDGRVLNDAELLGYQLRDIEGSNCKYLTALKNKEVKPYTNIGMGTRVTYLVEDLASGLVLNRALVDGGSSSHRVVVNYGVKCTPEVLAENVYTNYSIVWLDNDGDHIEDQARTISRTWELFSGKPCYIEDQYSDPKLLDHNAIQAVDQYWEAQYNG